MFYSVKNGLLGLSSDVHVTHDGAPVSNFTAWLEAKSPAERVAFGWYDELVTSEGPGDYWVDEYRVEDGKVVQTWIDRTPAPRAFQVSKLLLRQNLRALGLETALNGIIALSPEATTDWNDAVTLDSDSPLVLGAIATMVGMGLLTQEQTVDLMQRSRSEYQS